MSATLVGPSQGSYRKTVVEVVPVLIAYKGLSDRPSWILESRNEGVDSFKVSKGFLGRREGMSSRISSRRRYGNIAEVAEGVGGGLDEEGIDKKSSWALGKKGSMRRGLPLAMVGVRAVGEIIWS